MIALEKLHHLNSHATHMQIIPSVAPIVKLDRSPWKNHPWQLSCQLHFSNISWFSDEHKLPPI